MPRKQITNPADSAKKVTVVISAKLDGLFEVLSKGMPAGLPTTFNGKTITWVANFGFKPKAHHRVPQDKLDNQGFIKLLDEGYDIEFDRTDVTKVYYDGSGVKAWQPGLKLGDPPVGFT
jgi:hypothetical protein